jgi:hypothetical protein
MLNVSGVLDPGVPLSTPWGVIDHPAGGVDAKLHVTGEVPPVDCMPNVKGLPTMLPGRDVVVMDNGASSVSVRVRWAVCRRLPVAESTAWTLKVNGVPDVGVPLSTPSGESVQPAGGVPAKLQEIGAVPPVDCKAKVNGSPTTPPGREVVVMVRTGTGVNVRVR